MNILLLFLNLALNLAVLALCFFIVIWVLGLLGIVIPGQIMRVIYAIFVIVALIYLVTALSNGAGRFGLIHVGQIWQMLPFVG